MRTAMITNRFPELSEKFILNQVTGLIDQDVEVDVYSALAASQGPSHQLALKYDLAARTTYLDIPSDTRKRIPQLPGLLVSTLSTSPGSALRAFRRASYSTAAKNLKTLYFLRAFRGKEYPLVHAQFGPNGLVGAFLKDAGAARHLVVSFHGSDINSYPGRYGVGVYKGLYERADIVTAGTDFVRRKLVENGCPQEKIRNLPVGLRMEELDVPRAGERSSSLLLSVGRLHELKGHSYAIQAFALVHKSFPETQYVIVGEGGERDRLESLAETLGLRDHVHLVGPKADTDVAALYRKATLLVMPSVRMPDGAEETQGAVMQEAQACGLPVIATNIGGLPEGIRDGVTGYLVPERDVGSLSKRICELLGDEALRVRMGEAGRDFVRSNYDVRALTRRLIGIYEEAVRGSEPHVRGSDGSNI